MRRVITAIFVTVVTLAVLVLLARPARAAAPTKQSCISANEEAEKLKKKGALRASRASLLLCANAACPRIVRDDCAARITELDNVMPTITFTARDGAADTTAVSVTMDGEVLAKTVDGKPIDVDPGEHTFTFSLAGQPPQTQKLVVREGEKNRHHTIQFGEAPKADAPTGRLVVTSSAGASITVDGRQTTLGRFDAPVSAGSHEVKVSEAGKASATRIVEVKTGSTETLAVTLEPEKRSVLPWVLGGAAVVAAAAVVGGVLLFSSSSSDGKTNPPPNGSLGTVGLASFR